MFTLGGELVARALAEGKVDGFWANGMGAELAVRSGAGKIVLDVRRGDGPEVCFDYTLPPCPHSRRSTRLSSPPRSRMLRRTSQPPTVRRRSGAPTS